MANKRMFSMKIVDSDAFLDMPLTAQCLYFHLCMRADDDGFIGNPKRIQRTVGASDDDMKALIDSRFLLRFEEKGIVVIKHWRIHNTLQSDRYTPTVYLEEKSKLRIKDNKAYSLTEGKELPVRKTTAEKTPKPEPDEQEDEPDKKSGKPKRFIPPTVEEVAEYCLERNNGIDSQAFVDFYESKGWLVGKNKMKDWKAAVRTWEQRRRNEGGKISTRVSDVDNW